MNPIKKLFLNEYFILVLICFNALLIFMQGFPDLTIDDTLSWADDVISALFLIELTVKISHYGWKEYWNSHWNKFDFILVLISLPSLLMHLMPEVNLNLSILLVFRVFRVFKFFRFIKFFPRVEHIFLSARQAMAASGMVLIGFFVFIFIFSLLCCYLFRDIAPTTFGNPMTAYYSTFQVFTVEGWNGIPAEIEREATELGKTLTDGQTFSMRILFIFLFIVGGVFGLSIVNSIFVDAMVSNSNDEMEDDLEKLQEEFSNLHAKIDRITALLSEAEAKVGGDINLKK